MSGRLLLGLWLVVVWIALWGQISVSTAITGALVSATVLMVFPKSVPRRVATGVRPLAAVQFLMYFAWKLVQSNLVVAWQIIALGGRVRSGVIAVRLERVSDAAATLIGSTITLTPGTLTIEASRSGEDVTLYVHVLQVDDVEAVRQDLQGLARRATRAFGGVQAQAPASGEART